MSIVSDSSEEQWSVLFKVLGYSIEGLRRELPFKWKVGLYVDLISFLHESAIQESMPGQIIGQLDEVKGWFMAEYETLDGGGIN